MEDEKTDIEKLDVMLGYWADHNAEHISENIRWMEKAKKAGLEETAGSLGRVIELSEKVNEHIEKAREGLRHGRGAAATAGSGKREKTHKHEGEHEEGHLHVQLHGIGVIRTPYMDEAPHQPVETDTDDFTIIVNEEYGEGLRELEKFEFLYVLFYNDRVKDKPPLTVTPPSGGGIEVGVFSSRSPNRPNPVGLSIVRLKRIVENKIYITGIDALDMTPLLDIKPYMEKLDCKKGAGNGWADRQV
jgi:tRNA-Thr(GGU) m(6)t(6)A37 methyltransferase TsaA